MTAVPYRLDRIITIDAPRDLVFGFLTVSDQWAAWWGKGSEIDPRPGGRMKIVHPNGIEVGGEVLEVRAPERIVFTYGYASGSPIPAGASRVTIGLDDVNGSTRVHLTHDFADEQVAREHVQGWRFQLSLFANIVTDRLHANAANAVDAWFDVWAMPDPDARTRRVAEIASPAVSFRDRFSHLDGQDDVLAHITAAQRFMPGIRLTRSGPIRHCQGTVLADWAATAADGAPRGTGTNVFALGADGRIQSVVGLHHL